MKESTIQIQAVEYLSMNASRYDFTFFSVPNETLITVLTAFKVPKKTSFAIFTFFKKMGLTPGVADLIILHKGKAYCFEFKNEKGKQTDNQVIFMNNVRHSGCEYHIVRSLDELIHILKIYGIVK